MPLPPPRRPLRSAPILASLLLGLFAAGPARAVLIGLDVVPGLSRVSIEGTSRLVVDPGAPLDPVTIPVSPQTGAGTSGAPLPGGGSSDGLTAAVGGFLAVDLTVGPVPFLDFIASTSLLDVLPSGDWAPGPPGDAMPGPADLAFALEGGSDVALSLQAAVRDLALGASFSGSPLETAPGEFGFDLSGTNVEIAGGAVDVVSDVPGLGGRFGLEEGPLAFGVVPVGQGVLRDLGGGDFLLEIDLAFQLVFGPDEIGLPLPGELTVDVGAEIVAANFVVPEPGPAPLLALALLALPLAVRPPRARALRSAGPVLLLALVAGLAAGPRCPFNDDGTVGVGLEQCEDLTAWSAAGEEGQPPADEELKSSTAPQCGVPTEREAAAEAGNGEATVRVRSAIVQDNLLTGGTYECRVDFESLGTVTSTLPVLEANCAIDAVESFDFQDFQGDGGVMVFRAALDSLRLAPESVEASVQIECDPDAEAIPPGGGPPQTGIQDLSLDGAPLTFIVTPFGFGSCEVSTSLDVTRTSAGKLGDVQDLIFVYWDASEFTGFCSSDTDCAEGDRCVVGVCDGGEVGDSCQNPRDCDAGLLCSSTGRCSLGEELDRCGNDFDCQGDLYCASLQCQDGSRGDFCVGGAGQCDERLACAAPADGAVGTCTGGGPFESCTADDQCVDPLVCDGGVLCAECRQPADCDAGETCIEAVCSDTLDSCTDSGDCGPDAFCDFLELSPGGPPQQVCIECLTAGDCPAGEICSGGRCVECVSNADCPAESMFRLCAADGRCV